MRTRLPEHVWIALLVAPVGLAALSGCSSPSQEPAPQYVEPAWFAQQALEQEEYRAGIQACLDAKGWHITVDLQGGIEEPFTSQEEVERSTVDIDACRVQLGYPAGDPPPATAEQFEAQYDKLVDVRDCLVAQGLAMGPAPSKDAWVDQGLAMQEASATGSEGLPIEQFPDFWHPYIDEAFQSAAPQNQQELEGKCPQPWSTSW